MNIRSIADLVADSAVFAGLDRPRLEFVAGCGLNVHVDEGESIVRAGDPADRFWIVRRGRAEITVTGRPGGFLAIGTVGPGELLGVSWLAEPFRFVFDARASVPTDAVQFDASCLRAKCEDDHELGYVLHQNLATIMRDLLQSSRLQLLDLCERRHA